MRDFRVKWGILEEKTHDFRLNGGFPKRKRMIYALMRDLRRENAGFSPKCGICEEKTRDFHINGGFAKRKRVIFA